MIAHFFPGPQKASFIIEETFREMNESIPESVTPMTSLIFGFDVGHFYFFCCPTILRLGAVEMHHSRFLTRAEPLYSALWFLNGELNIDITW